MVYVRTPPPTPPVFCSPACRVRGASAGSRRPSSIRLCIHARSYFMSRIQYPRAATPSRIVSYTPAANDPATSRAALYLARTSPTALSAAQCARQYGGEVVLNSVRRQYVDPNRYIEWCTPPLPCPSPFGVQVSDVKVPGRAGGTHAGLRLFRSSGGSRRC